MNRFGILTVLAMIMMAAFAVSCDDVNDQTQPVEYLDVNANNISGSWELVEWNGSPLDDGTYVFIEFVRNDKTYRMWQNIDSFTDVPHEVSGRFFLETDPELGAIIRGDYDHDSGDWAHRYIIRELTADWMIWVAKDDPEYIQKFERIESVPVAY